MTNTMADSTSIATRAFAIFSDQIINEITNESLTYSAENDRLRPLKQYLNKFEVHVGNELIALCNFDSAKVDECPHCACGQKVANWDVTAEKPTLISDAVRSRLGLKIVVAGQHVGDFSSYHPLFMVPSHRPFVCICHLMSQGSGHSVYGRLQGFTEDDIELLTDTVKSPREEFLLPSGHSLSPGCSFHIYTVTCDWSQEMEDSLKCLTQPELGTNEPSEELRQLVMSAIGDQDVIRRHKENNVLKIENKMLTSMHERVNEVYLKYNDGMNVGLNFQLTNGKGRECQNDHGAQWNLSLKEDTYHKICVNDIPSLRLWVSGVELSVKSFHYSDHTFAIVFENRVRLFGSLRADENHTGDSEIDLSSQGFQTSLYTELNNPPSTAYPNLYVWLDNLWFDDATVRPALDLLDGSSSSSCADEEEDECCVAVTKEDTDTTGGDDNDDGGGTVVSDEE